MMNKEIPDFAVSINDLGLPDNVLVELTAANLTGLVVIGGPLASGKTTTALSIVDARLQEWGGKAVTIENPIEYGLTGPRGEGSCDQLQQAQGEGSESTFAAQIEGVMRRAPDMILLGQIRDKDTAMAAVEAAVRGCLVITTIHAGSVDDAVMRLASLAAGESADTSFLMLMNNLRMVIYPERAVSDRPGDSKATFKVLTSSDFADASLMRSLIARGMYSRDQRDIEGEVNDGKTTTLQDLQTRLPASDLIVSIEDPVEIRVRDTTQRLG